MDISNFYMIWIGLQEMVLFRGEAIPSCSRAIAVFGRGICLEEERGD